MLSLKAYALIDITQSGIDVCVKLESLNAYSSIFSIDDEIGTCDKVAHSLKTYESIDITI